MKAQHYPHEHQQTSREDEIVNLTTHPLSLYQQDRRVGLIQPSGTVASVDLLGEEIGTLAGLPLYAVDDAVTRDLPDPEANRLYVVSCQVYASNPDRQDLLIPADLYRIDGCVYGCGGFEIRGDRDGGGGKAR